MLLKLTSVFEICKVEADSLNIEANKNTFSSFHPTTISLSFNTLVLWCLRVAEKNRDLNCTLGTFKINKLEIAVKLNKESR
jgi:hypothetical protein